LTFFILIHVAQSRVISPFEQCEAYNIVRTSSVLKDEITESKISHSEKKRAKKMKGSSVMNGKHCCRDLSLLPFCDIFNCSVLMSNEDFIAFAKLHCTWLLRLTQVDLQRGRGSPVLAMGAVQPSSVVTGTSLGWPWERSPHLRQQWC